MGEYRLKIGDFALMGIGWPKISRWRGHPHQPSKLVDETLEKVSEDDVKRIYRKSLNKRHRRLFVQ